MTGELEKRIEARKSKRVAGFVTIPDVNEVIKEMTEEVFPLPKGDIVMNPRTGERTCILLNFEDWLPHLQTLRKWLGDEIKEKFKSHDEEDTLVK